MKLYKPSQSNKGAAFSINFSAKTDKYDENNRLTKGDKSFYLQLCRQNGWNAETKNGSFKDGYKVIVKLAPHEAAAMLAAINRNISMAEAMSTKYVYHDGDSSSTTITFEPFFKAEKKGETWVKSTVQSGFSLKVLKADKKNTESKETIAIALNWAETELFKQYLTNGLFHIAEAWRGETFNSPKKKVAPKAEPEQVQEEVPAEEPVESSDVDDFMQM